MAALPLIGPLIGAMSSSAIAPAITAGGTLLSGVAGAAAANNEAKQMEAKGKEEFAASQREAQEKRREAALVQSRQQAVAAASGAGAGMDAPTIVKLMTDTAGQGEFNAQTVRYGGENRRNALFAAASNRRASGRASLLGSVFSSFGTLAKGMA